MENVDKIDKTNTPEYFLCLLLIYERRWFEWDNITCHRMASIASDILLKHGYPYPIIFDENKLTFQVKV